MRMAGNHPITASQGSMPECRQLPNYGPSFASAGKPAEKATTSLAFHRSFGSRTMAFFSRLITAIGRELAQGRGTRTRFEWSNSDETLASLQAIPTEEGGDCMSAIADIGASWVLSQQCGGLLTVAASRSRTAASCISELTLPTQTGRSTASKTALHRGRTKSFRNRFRQIPSNR
jgi:hypothetical protein